MPVIDIVLFVIIGGFGLAGLAFGLVHTLGSLVGTVAGAYLASRYYEPVANWLISITGWNANLSRVVIFILTFLIINRLVGFLFWIVDRALSIITRLPFIHSLNKILGLVFGVLEGAITLGLIIFFIERYPISPAVMNQLALSNVAPALSRLGNILWPLLPDALRLVQSSINYVQGIFVH